MQKEFYYKPYTINVPANTLRPIPIEAAHVYIKAVSSSSVQIQIDSSTPERIWPGLHFDMRHGESFRSVKLNNPTGAAVSVTILFSSEQITDSSFILGDTINVNLTPDLFETPAAVTATTAGVTIAADTSRREIILQNHGTVDVWAGDSNVNPATSCGYKIAASKSIVLTTAAAIVLKSASGTAVVSIAATRAS